MPAILIQARPLWRWVALALLIMAFGSIIVSAQDIAAWRVNVAALILDGKFTEAEARAKQWLAVAERGGVESLEVAEALEAMIKIYAGLKRVDDAEAAWRRCLELRLKAVGPKHALITQTLDVMAGVYLDNGRKTEAQALWRDGLAAYQKRPPVAAIERLPNPPNTTHREVPDLIAKGQAQDAEAVLRRNGDQAALATFLLDRGRTEEALAIHRRLLDLAPTAERAVNAATLYRQRNLDKPEQELLARAVAIQEKALGSHHSDLIPTLTALATSFERHNDIGQAYTAMKRASGIAATARAKQAFTNSAAITLRSRQPHLEFLRIAARLTRERPAQAKTIATETFEAGQLAIETVLNAAVGQMGLRLSKGIGPLPDLIRGRQDLEREWQRLDKLLLSAVTGAATAIERNSLRSQITTLEQKLAALDAQLQRSFPQYFELALPTPVGVVETRALLRESEALAQFAAVGEGAYVWIVTRSDVRWAALAQAPQDIETEVAALRCGLDYEGSWGPRALPEVTRRCRDLVKRTYSEADSRVPRPLPFDLNRAHRLYTALFGPVQDLVAGKDLLLVLSGSLSSLPPQVFVTRPAESSIPVDWSGYARASWLTKTSATTVLPSVASLKALRQQAGRSPAANPYAAFANPVLTGPSGTDNRAEQRQACDDAVAGPTRLARAPAVRGVPGRYLRGELALPAKVRELVPLVETADEVCAVAKQLGGTSRDVFLASRATERMVKTLSASGALSTYRVIHFATHGLLASETEIDAGGPPEPALVLTPPNKPSQEDDGLLTAGEILQLRLNTDWVILSACNTAGGERTGADALSGLARAFFYAGSRALLVSHWAVDSAATVTLITRTFESLRNTPPVGRVQAVRAAMLSMIAAGAEGAHPAYWAPFAVVGEGSFN